MKFRKAPAFTVALLITFSFTAYGQTGDLNYMSYYYDYKLLNPAFTGIEDKHIINTVYSGFPSGYDGSPKLLYGSYETSIRPIKSGLGALAAYDGIGSYETFQGAIFFNKKLPFTDRSGMHIGTRISYRHDESNISDLDLQTDPGEDPILGSGNETSDNINFDFGLLYYSSIVNAGVSIKDVVKEDGREPAFNAILTREFKIANWLKVSPSIVYTTDFDRNTLDFNSTFEVKQWFLLGASYSIEEGGNILHSMPA